MIPHSRYFPIPRVASSAITKAILETHYPARAEFVAAAIVRRPTASWGSFSLAPTVGSVRVGVLRAPVERFRSACATTGKTVEQGLECLLTHPCFVPVSGLGTRGVRWFIYETQFAEFCAELGIAEPPVMNSSVGKPVLTDEQVAAVRAAYAADVALYETTVAAIPAPEAASPADVPDSIPFWRAKVVLQAAGLFDSIPAMLAAMPEPDRTWALAAWEGQADIHRNGATVLFAVAALGLTDAQVDAMFIQAASPVV